MMNLFNVVIAVLAASAPLHKDYITYEDYGAIGDGKHDDQAAIVAAHAAANRENLPVKATEGSTYYIGGGKSQAIIRTDTDWTGAKFIIDDVALEDVYKQVFVVESKLKSYKLDELKTLRKGQKKLGISFPRKSLLLVVDKNSRVYLRKGLNRNSGKAQQEVLLVEKDGKLYDRALPVFNYNQVTECTVFPIDEQPLVIKGGIFTTIANQAVSDYRYYNRGISIRRSNVIVDGITHYVTGELDHGAPYNGFISTLNAACLTIRNCVLTGHRTYRKIGSAKKPVSMGTYDLSFTSTVNLHLENVSQTNGINDKVYWGLMGSNYCKDMYMDGCTVSRFDAHMGVENVTLKNCTFGLNGGVRMVGCGTIYMENCTTYANYLVHLRPDYGSSWEGNIIVRNCILRPVRAKTSEVSILDGSNNGDHNFGYECMLPALIRVDGLTIDDSAVKNERYKGPCIFSSFGRDVSRSGLEPYKATKKVILKNVSVVSGRELRVSDNEAMFSISVVSSSTSSVPASAQVREILKNIHAPEFRNMKYFATDYGVKADGVTDARDAINAIIARCSGEGGGKVVLPVGKVYCKGSINLKDNVNLYLPEGCEVVFSGNPLDYLPAEPTVWEGTRLYNYSSPVRSYRCTNIAVTGKGVLNGSASVAFVKMRERRSAFQEKLRQMGADGVPVSERCFGAESALPPNMVEPYGCTNVLIEGITIKDSPFWTIHPVFCDNVIVRGVTIDSHNPNNDGCDPEYSTNVLIEKCRFDTGDDSVAIKAGRDADGWRTGGKTSGIIVRDCDFNSLCNGLCIGSEMSGGVENVYMYNVRISDCHRAVYFKSNLDRGGYIRNVWIDNIRVGNVKTALICFDNNYHGARGGYHPSEFKGFSINNVRCSNAEKYGISAIGEKEHPIRGISFGNVSVDNCSIPLEISDVEDVHFHKVVVNGVGLPEIPSVNMK